MGTDGKNIIILYSDKCTGTFSSHGCPALSGYGWLDIMILYYKNCTGTFGSHGCRALWVRVEGHNNYTMTNTRVPLVPMGVGHSLGTGGRMREK